MSCRFGDDPGFPRNFLVIQTEGRRRIRRYKPDAIIAVGYRVNPGRGVRFRRWAPRTLRDHLVRGYTLSERRLAERGTDEARQILDLLARTLRNQALVDDSGETGRDLIEGYADTRRRGAQQAALPGTALSLLDGISAGKLEGRNKSAASPF